MKRGLRNGNLVLYEDRYVPNYDKARSLVNDYSIRGIGRSVDIFLNERKVGDRVLPIALEEAPFLCDLFSCRFQIQGSRV